MKRRKEGNDRMKKQKVVESDERRREGDKDLKEIKETKKELSCPSP